MPRRRALRAVAALLTPDEHVTAVARDAVERDFWVLTERRLFQVREGVVTTQVALDQLTGHVAMTRVGVTIQLRSRSDFSGVMLTTFRRPNDVTRRLEALLPRPVTG